VARAGCCGRLVTSLYLQAHPIAIDYFETHNGVVYLAEVVDHIIPHRGDMKLFWDRNNWQGLTKADHDCKTALEDSGFGRRVKDGAAREGDIGVKRNSGPPALE